MVRRPVLLAGAALAMLAPAGVAEGAWPKPRTVKVADDFFGPAKLTVRKDTMITWRWSADNRHTHDVWMTRRRPKGVKRFHSDSAAYDYSFRRRLRTRGTYRFYCSFHATSMRMTIVVK